ncbi:MAG: hypothetical protein Q7T33_08230 [Dehalococcoidia bacterium]|nr:hypothetical protein [Dehalococcoidia bacterium]
MTTAADLFALQETDRALDRANERLAEIEAALGETEELVEARQQAELKRQAAAAFRSRQTELEWSVDEVRGKAAQVESKLYGGTVGNPKELADLDADLRSLRALTRTREDTLLGLLVELEDADSELRSAEAVCSGIEKEWQEGQQTLLQEQSQIEPDVPRLEAQREGQAGGIDRGALSLYQLLRERRGGQAVARVERGMCQGCRITLPMSVLQKARTGLGLVQCVSCERILLVS